MSKKAKKQGSSLSERDWTPVRNGTLYCSPACGGRCKWGEYQRAVRDASHLVKSLRGHGWKPVVWENLGWHFQAVSGPVQIYGDRHGPGGRLRYSCMISSEVDGTGGSSLWTNPDARSYFDPNKAVKAELLAALRATLVVIYAVRDAAWAAGHDSPVQALDELLKTHVLSQKPTVRRLGRARRS